MTCIFIATNLKAGMMCTIDGDSFYAFTKEFRFMIPLPADALPMTSLVYFMEKKLIDLYREVWATFRP